MQFAEGIEQGVRAGRVRGELAPQTERRGDVKADPSPDPSHARREP